MQLRLLVAERLVEDFVEHFALGTAPTLYQSILEVTLRDLYIYVYVYIYIYTCTSMVQIETLTVG